MKLTQVQKVAIYASALQGQMARETFYPNQCIEDQLRNARDVVNNALLIGDELIAALEARKDVNEADPTEEIPDA